MYHIDLSDYDWLKHPVTPNVKQDIQDQIDTVSKEPDSDKKTRILAHLKAIQKALI